MTGLRFGSLSCDKILHFRCRCFQFNIQMHSASAGSKYMSHDPAPAFEKVKMSAVELGDLLVDQNKGMFDRYRAMFSLRNLDTEEAVHVL